MKDFFFPFGEYNSFLAKPVVFIQIVTKHLIVPSLVDFDVSRFLGIGKGNDAAAQQQRRYVAGSLLNAGIGRAKVVGRSSLLTCDDSLNLCFFCSI